MNIKNIHSTCLEIKENINTVIIGKSSTIDLILTSILAGGHVLLEDTPGTGKTIMAKALAKSIDGNFNRIQFTPDLLPSDITGLNIFNVKESEFNFVEGPIFTNILLADEINRATPRTQSSLLEAMEEKQVTIDGETRTLDKPFLVIATENPIENSGTFPLPEAQLDRFMMKLSLGYPTFDEEVNIINRFILNDPLAEILPISSYENEHKEEMQNLVKEVFIHDDIKKYIVEIVQATRNNSNISLGVSPRGTLALLRACQSFAAINGREYVIPDDVKTLASPILAHRIISTNGLNNSYKNTKLINNIISDISVPTESWEK